MGKWEGGSAPRPAEAGKAGDVPEAGTRKVLSSKPPPSRETETVATRPIETDPRAEKEASPPSARRALVSGLVLGVAGVAVAAFFLGKGAGTPDAVPGMTTTTASTVAPTGTASAPASTTGKTPSTATAGMTGTAVPPPASATLVRTAVPVGTGATAGPPPGPASASAAERATLTLLGDGTTVTVDGIPRGPCPVKVAVDPGPHSVVFAFAATGESKGTSLPLKASDRATLRADFTGATPTIRIER